MDISIILCTFNRCDRLRTALESIRGLQGNPLITWELIVVDNNSKDRTKEIVDRYINEGGNNIHYMFEAQQGKSFALNTGIQAAKGEILAFTDDDVTFHPRWLCELKGIFDKYDCMGTGGKIIPVLESVIPSWLILEGPFLGPLVAFDLGTDPFPLTRSPFGANMAFRNNAFKTYGYFRTDLGPIKGNSMGKGEDSEFCSRLITAGETLMYAPDAKVYHPVEKERMQKKYYRSWYFNYGRASVIRSDPPPDQTIYYFGVPRYLYRIILRKLVRWLSTFDKHQRYCCKLDLYQSAGEIVEFHQRNKSSKLSNWERISKIRDDQPQIGPSTGFQ